MKKRTFQIVALVYLIFAAAASYAQTKIDPYLDTAAESAPAKALSISVIPPTPDKGSPADVFIKTDDAEKTAASVRADGGSVHAVVGRIVTATIPNDKIADIANSDEVIFIEAAKPIEKSNDVATQEINVTEVREGGSLPSGYTGSGVIVGIVDTGIDYRHEDFLDANGKSRILAIWDQTRRGGSAPAEISDSYGTECLSQSIANGSCPMNDTDAHGTHVAGIAAGRDEKYGGVAPDANIIMVKYDASLDLESGYADAIFSTKICDAAYYVFAKAEKMGMPAVANLSLGTHIGAHDGTSLFEECLSGLVKGYAGRSLVAAAGNEYSSDSTYTGIHAGFSVNDSTAATNFVIRSLTSDRIYYIDLWGDTAGKLSIGLSVNEGEPKSSPLETSDMVSSGGNLSGSFLGGMIKYKINATETTSVLNGKQHVGIRIILDPSLANPENYSFDLIVSGKGSFDAWLFPDKPSKSIQFTSVSGKSRHAYEFISGDRAKNIAIPATSADVIAVAGYTTRNSWTSGSITWNFSGQELGSILNFSSAGPTAAPDLTGTKPEIAAPGGMIASTLSSSASVSSQTIMDDGRHFLQAGTSMAAPFVSGTIALMFQANSNFTQDDVKKFLTQGAYVDSYMGAVPNDRWGYGKLDALKTMEIAVNGAASGSFNVNGSVATPPADESTGKSSCAMVPLAPAGAGSAIEFLMIAASACAAAVARRRASIRQ